MTIEPIALNNIKKLGELLRDSREAEKITQGNLADISGISMRTISSLESGNYERGTNLKTIYKLFSALNIESELAFRRGALLASPFQRQG